MEKLYNNIEGDRWFSSSKMCSCCGAVKETLLLSEKVYVCESCGMVKDRDRNAADNLEKYGRNKIGAALSSELTPMDKTVVNVLDEVGISECLVMST